jgi:hypothetical protein
MCLHRICTQVLGGSNGSIKTSPFTTANNQELFFQIHLKQEPGAVGQSCDKTRIILVTSTASFDVIHTQMKNYSNSYPCTATHTFRTEAE